MARPSGTAWALICARWHQVAFGLTGGALLTLSIAALTTSYYTPRTIVATSLSAAVATVGGERVLTVHFQPLRITVCQGATEHLLEHMENGVMVRWPLGLTVNGVRPDGGGPFDLRWDLPHGMEAGVWSYRYRAADQCAWGHFWTVFTLRDSVPVTVVVPNG